MLAFTLFTSAAKHAEESAAQTNGEGDGPDHEIEWGRLIAEDDVLTGLPRIWTAPERSELILLTVFLIAVGVLESLHLQLGERAIFFLQIAQDLDGVLAVVNFHARILEGGLCLLLSE